jgi:two-component system sensor histidine kinase KdpD
VETPQDQPTLEDQERIDKTLRLAAQLGGQAVKLSGFNLRDAILDFVREQGVSKIVLAQPRQPFWRRLRCASLADQLRRRGGHLDFHLISDAATEARPRRAPRRNVWLQVWEYSLAATGVGLCTGLAFVLFPYFALVNLVMLYLLTVVVIASRLNQGPSIFASLISVVVFAFFFVPHYYSFSLANTEYAITLAVMLILIIRPCRRAAKTHNQQRDST